MHHKLIYTHNLALPPYYLDNLVIKFFLKVLTRVDFSSRLKDQKYKCVTNTEEKCFSNCNWKYLFPFLLQNGKY